MAETVAAGRAQQLVENSLPGVPEWRMPHVVAEADRLREILVQPQGARHDARDARRLEGVGDARTVVVSRRVDEDLCFSLQAAERLRVDDAVAVALKRRADAAFFLGLLAAAALVRAHGEGRQGVALQLAHTGREGVGNSSGQLRHAARVVGRAAVTARRPGGHRPNGSAPA